MAEFYDGFVPFKTYEVGNDNNPFGWNTATAMKLINGTVTAMNASGDYTEFEVIKPVVNPLIDIEISEEYDPFVKGIWNGILAGSEGGEPYFSNISLVSGKNNVKINGVFNKANGFPPTGIGLMYAFEGGDDVSISYAAYTKDGTPLTNIMTTTAKNGKIELDNIIAAVSSHSDVEIKLSGSNGKSVIVSGQNISLVYPIIYGCNSSMSINPSDLEKTGVLDHMQVSNEVCAYGAVTYELNGDILTDDSRAYMYFAVPSALGPIMHLTNGSSPLNVPTGIQPKIYDDLVLTTANVYNQGYYLYVSRFWNNGTYRFMFKTVEDTQPPKENK